jgi:hypothetical protein
MYWESCEMGRSRRLSREVVVALGCELMSCEKCEKGR